ncbi:unnamed protein product, partial [Discosporangium mesarthrocarpum]
DGREFKITYGSGPVSGVLSTDSVDIGGLHLEGQTFAEAWADPTPRCVGCAFDGIAGMAFDEISVEGVKTPFHNLIDQGALDEPASTELW